MFCLLALAATLTVIAGDRETARAETVSARLVKDIWPGSSSSSAANYESAVGETLFFTADDGTNGVELWKSDGTEDGTVMVKDINPDRYNEEVPEWLTAVGDSLFFSADSPNRCRQRHRVHQEHLSR